MGVVLSQKPQMWRPIPIVVASPPTAQHWHFVDFQLRGATIGIVRGCSHMLAGEIVDIATAFGNRAQVRLSPAQTSGNWHVDQDPMKAGIAAERSEGRA